MSVRFETDAEPIPGYKLMDRLGSGGFGEVWRCVAPGGIFKAVKVIHGDLRNRETDAYRFAEQELKALKRVKMVRHPYLLALDRYDIVDGRLVIIMELADCNLWDRFRVCRKEGHQGIPRAELLQYMSESAEVLDLMYDKHQLQHLDIKPQNLFLLYNHVKVADFGQVKDLEGLVASVTGGITPVYAAPETFDGFVSRYCDQYSLACVYQELLTGQRPFDGNSMQQLLMQHLQSPPNLNPSPAAERPALARALAKKPEDRFPSVMAMVNALRESGDGVRRVVSVPVAVAIGGPDGLTNTNFSGSYPVDTGSPVGGSSGAFPAYNPATSMPNGPFEGGAIIGGVDVTPFPRSGSETSAPLDRPAPNERLGTGCLRPAIIIGVGYSGLRVVQRFRKQMEDRYGSLRKMPTIRTLYIDTDPESLDAASASLEADFSPIPTDDVIPVKLNRAAHYLKPRVNGRALIEGWFDSQVLYKLPRTPMTMGLRQLGRLAFCDHYRAIMLKLQGEIDACITSEAMATSIEATGEQQRTNRPRIYIVAGLGGGTGSGMVFDLAYSLRARLRRIGYTAADVVGLLLTPADGPPSAINQTALANSYAALTELNHFSSPDTTYVASFDERHGSIRDREPPFSRVYVVPGLDYPASVSGTTGVAAPPPIPGRSASIKRDAMTRSTIALRAPAKAKTTDPCELAADYLRLDLGSLVGRTAESAARPLPIASVCDIRTFGLQRFSWPRAELVARTARIIAPVLLNHWVSPDSQVLRAVVTTWVEPLRNGIGLTTELLMQRLKTAADKAAGLQIEEIIQQAIEPLTPKGWLGRGPDQNKVSLAVDLLTKLLGPPRESPNRKNSEVENKLEETAAILAKEVTTEIVAAVPALLDNPDYRLAGAEEAVRQLMIGIEMSQGKLSEQVPQWVASAGIAYDRLANHIYQHKGVKKPTPQEIMEAMRDYPTNWYGALVGTQVLAILEHVHAVLLSRLAELSACRQRVEEFHRKLVAEAELPANTTTPSDASRSNACWTGVLETPTARATSAALITVPAVSSCRKNIPSRWSTTRSLLDFLPAAFAGVFGITKGCSSRLRGISTPHL